MATDNLRKRLSKNSDLTTKEINLVTGYFTEQSIPKKTVILKAGEIAQKAYYINKGCMRVFYVKEDVEISAYFFTEDMFTNACESFIGQKPSRHFIEAAEDSEVLSISYNKLEELYTKLPKANAFFRKMMEERFEAIHNSFTAQILETPEERYSNLQKNNPSLINRIPQHQIATYLGITPISLSRIRSRLKKKP
ncbi:MAG: Crp/Fnr family transcriptional regulator [Sediminibacterium sp.]|nr:Crp/Fnr family transcriptional regulator [Sediminibacterium sp.]MBX9779809.1 Crp/Fnr family transcriptional regulator [Chitinophagaceae bacterium]